VRAAAATVTGRLREPEGTPIAAAYQEASREEPRATAQLQQAPDPGPIATTEAAGTAESQQMEHAASLSEALADDQDLPIDSETCPRCGITCGTSSVDEVFGFRTTTWTTSSGLTMSAVRRQSYCRRCRTEHAARPREQGRSPRPDDTQDTALEALEPHTEPLPAPDATGIVGDVTSSELDQPSLPARQPRLYRPQVRSPSVPKKTSSLPGERETRDRALPIDVRMVFERAGFCRMSLLPRRGDGMPIELAVSGSGAPPDLMALQGDWYQDISPASLDHLLRNGIEWIGALPDGDGVRWSLSGREIYVLAGNSKLNGFVSTPRLILGEEHVVLCVTERLDAAREAIAEAGSPTPTLLTPAEGIPTGWAGLRGVIPHKAVAASPTADILDALRPRADVEVVLEGGIRIDRQAWLTGYPPTIRVRGDTSTIGAITIDGHPASLAIDGTLIAAGMDSPGEHIVWCNSDSRSYSIRDGAETWQPWDAYTWSLGDASVSGPETRPTICGALVRPPRAAQPNGQATVVPAAARVLVGPRPGDIEICQPRSDIHSGLCIGFPSFEPVWALPHDALRCRKDSSRVRLMGPPNGVVDNDEGASAQHRGPTQGARPRSRAVALWCETILAAARKGLRTEPAREDVVALWRTYHSYARALWKSYR
jgi:hypothetical protein